jgi:flagellar protein FlgJ
MIDMIHAVRGEGAQAAKGVNHRLRSEGGAFARVLEEHLPAARFGAGAEDARKLTNAGPVGRDENDRKLLDACYEMESIFVGLMLKTMRKAVPQSGFFGESLANDIFRDMLYDEYAKMMARSDQFGIARQIYDQLRVRTTI